MINMAAAFLIRTAYPTKVDEFEGAPPWVMSERFDVDARATFVPTVEQERVMLRALLTDRFKFSAHYEARERPIYNLLLARRDGRLGAQLRRIDVNCATYKRAAPISGERGRSVSDPPLCGYRLSAGSGISIVSGGQSMQSLADSISGNAGRAIIDKTGLTGYYAYKLEFGGASDEVSIFTALQEQLGLTLEPARGPLDVVVIDHIERPTEN